MKKTYILIFLTILFLGCNDFLEPKSQDQVIPKHVEQLKEMLLGEIIQEKEDFLQYLPPMTDDFDDKFGDRYEYRNDLWGYYTWQQEPENSRDNVTKDDKAWGKLYHTIFVCNIIIHDTPDLEGTEDEKNQLLAETYFIRAQSYFCLVNLYGEPYENAEQAKTALGVPINHETTILNKRYTRSTLAEVYTLIESDLRESIRRFKNVVWEKNYVRPSQDVAYLLASRFYLYKKEYQLAKNYTDSIIQNNRYQFYNLPETPTSEYRWFLHSTNPEIMFCYGMVDFGYVYTTARAAVYVASNSLKSLFITNDLRKASFISQEIQPHKYNDATSNCYGNTYRWAEVYLNRAEALVYLDDWQKAIEAINILRENRIKGNYQIEATSKEDALQKVREERRRELCYEGHRWFDLRRYGMPELRHTFNTSSNTHKEYVLEAGSKAYILPIPQAIRRQNTIIENVNRPVQN